MNNLLCLDMAVPDAPDDDPATLEGSYNVAEDAVVAAVAVVEFETRDPDPRLPRMSSRRLMSLPPPGPGFLLLGGCKLNPVPEDVADLAAPDVVLVDASSPIK
jgi:ferritin-like protein